MGDALEHAVSPLQAFQPRRGHRHAVGRPLARRESKAYGELRSQPGHLIDLMATCVDVGRRDLPQGVQGPRPFCRWKEKACCRPLANRPIERDAIYWEHEGNRAVRVGKWKLVAAFPPPVKWELYDMEQDRTELHDLAAVKPGLFTAMVAQWELWARRTHAIPWPWQPPYRHPSAKSAAAANSSLIGHEATACLRRPRRHRRHSRRGRPIAKTELRRHPDRRHGLRRHRAFGSKLNRTPQPRSHGGAKA